MKSLLPLSGAFSIAIHLGPNSFPAIYKSGSSLRLGLLNRLGRVKTSFRLASMKLAEELREQDSQIPGGER